MALAGPATNYTLMLIAAVCLRVGWAHGWLLDDLATGRPDFATNVLGAFFSLNLLLGTFNLLPVPPLDGSSAIMLFMSAERAQRYLDWLRASNYGMLGLLLAIVTFRYVYGPIRAIATEVLLRSHF
jgi:Zn-dependent protease